MGRPRSKNRMSRMVQARVTDEQYDYLAERAIDVYDGDMSAALRACITWAGYFETIITAADPGEEVRRIKAEWAEAEDERYRLRMDQPDEESDED